METQSEIEKPDTDTSNATFELHVDNAEQASPSIFFTWCLSPQALEHLKKEGVQHPLLFVALLHADRYDKDGEVIDWDDRGAYSQRILLPLERGGAYIQIRQPGKYRLIANVIWSGRKNAGLRAAMADRSEALERSIHSSDMYRDNLVGYCLGPYSHWMGRARLEHTAEIPLHVDKSLFAELPGWLTWWCNLMLPKMRDSCAWRRRMPFVFLLQPFLAVGWILLKTLFRFIALIGMLLFAPRWSEISLRPLVHPFSMTIEMLIKDREAAWKKERHWLIEGARMPFCWIFFLALGYGLYSLPWSLIGDFVLYWMTESIIGLGVVLCITALVALVIQKIRLLNSEEVQAAQQKQIEEMQKAARERFYQTTLQPLVCEPTTKPRTMAPGIQRLPRSHRTAWVRFAAMKASVCKPFAGS